MQLRQGSGEMAGLLDEQSARLAREVRFHSGTPQPEDHETPQRLEPRRIRTGDRQVDQTCGQWTPSSGRLSTAYLSHRICTGTRNMLTKLWNDEAGFIISAELVLVATILVIGCIVGLSEVQHAVVSELNDVGDAIGSINQSFCFSGFNKTDG